MCEIKVDSRRNAILASLRGSEATEAIHKTPKADSREAYFASAKFMDRHADKSARDDRETSKVANPNHTNQAEGFLMRKQGCEAFCAEIRLGSPIAQAKGKLPALSQKANARRKE